MSDKMIENNQVTMMGEIVSPFLFSHEVFGEGFYMVEVDVKRLSNSKDRIPLMISERLIDVSKDYTGEFIMVNGQFRSYNRHEEMKNRLILSVFVRELFFIEEELDGAKTNQILLDGYICKQPVYRKTPLGREIADLLLAVNRPYGKSDTFHVSAGEGMPDSLLHLKLGSTCRWLEEFRAVNIRRRSQKQKHRKELPTRYRSASWNVWMSRCKG